MFLNVFRKLDSKIGKQGNMVRRKVSFHESILYTLHDT